MLIPTMLAKAILRSAATRVAKGEAISSGHIKATMKAIDSLGDGDGTAEISDVIDVAKDFGAEAVDKIQKAIDFLSDIDLF